MIIDLDPWKRAGRDADLGVNRALALISRGWFEREGEESLECLQDARGELRLAMLRLDSAIEMLEEEVVSK